MLTLSTSMDWRHKWPGLGYLIVSTAHWRRLHLISVYRGRTLTGTPSPQRLSAILYLDSQDGQFTAKKIRNKRCPFKHYYFTFYLFSLVNEDSHFTSSCTESFSLKMQFIWSMISSNRVWSKIVCKVTKISYSFDSIGFRVKCIKNNKVFRHLL